MFPSIQNARWKLLDTEVAWARSTSDAGVIQKRRQLMATVQAEASGESIAAYGAWFNNLASTMTDFVCYVGAQQPQTGATPDVQIILSGEWVVENCRTAFDRGTGTVTLVLWVYTGAWTDVDAGTQ